jgi:hypothetical protein
MPTEKFSDQYPMPAQAWRKICHPNEVLPAPAISKKSDPDMITPAQHKANCIAFRKTLG